MMPLDPSTSSSIRIPVPNPSEQALLEVKEITFMDSDLYKAAEDGDMEPFNNYQGDLRCLVDGRQNTALHIYSRTGGRQVVEKRFLCSQKKRTEFCINFVEQLVSKCSISLLLQPNAEGEIPLHIAARHGHSDMVKFLIECIKVVQPEDLEKGSEATRVRMRQILSMEDKEKNTALHNATQSGDLEVVQLLLKELDPDFSFSANTSGATPLYIAARNGYHHVVAEMLDNCKSINYGGPDGTTALHGAVLAGSEETVRKLIKAKKHLIRETDDKGRTPLHYAAYFDSLSILKILLKIDSSAAYMRDKVSEATALHMAAWRGETDIMEEIIWYCPGCCEIVDKRGWNFLHFAVFTSDLRELHRFLLGDKNKINDLPLRNLLNQKDVNGNTPWDVLNFGSSDYRSGENAVFRLFKSHKFQETVNYSPETKQKQIRILLMDIGNTEAVAGTPLHLTGFPKIELEEDIPEDETKEKAREAHLVVATLVATVTFTAAFAVPGGYKSEEGTATLIHDSAFKAFVITDTLAFLSSLSAICIHFYVVSVRQATKLTFAVIRWNGVADCLTFYAMLAMVVAFSTGTYAVLRSSLGFAIASCSLALFFVPGVFLFPIFPVLTELVDK